MITQTQLSDFLKMCAVSGYWSCTIWCFYVYKPHLYNW